MQHKQQLLDEFSTLISFVESLRELDDQIWMMPIAEGKWTPRDIVAHIMLWDQYFLEEAIQKITSQQPVTLQHLDLMSLTKMRLNTQKRKADRKSSI